MLDGHVLDLEGQELSPSLAVVQNLAWCLGVDMDADDAAVTEGNHRFSDLIEIIENRLLIERRDISDLCRHELENEFGAIAVGQITVLVEL